MDESAAIAAIFGDEDLDLESLAALAEASVNESPAVLEALMREHLSLPELDVEGAIRSAEAGRVAARPTDRDADDFTDEEWVVVRAMRKFCLDAISPATPARRLSACVEWIFVRGTEDKSGVSFHLACEMLYARPWVIQCLVQHFWFSRGLSPGTLPFLADTLPEAVEHEALLHGWEGGGMIARAVWSRPGMLTTDLQDAIAAPHGDVATALDAVLGAGILSVRLGRLHVTTRHETFRQTRQPVSWSNSLIGE